MEKKSNVGYREPFYIGMVIIFIILVLGYLLLPREQVFYFSASIYPIIALLPIAIYLLSAKRIGFSWEDKLSVLIVFNAIGGFFWFIAEVIWCYCYNLLLDIEVPYPSEADIFYVGAAIFVVLGIAIYVNSLYQDIKEEVTVKEKTTAAFFTAVLTLIVAIVLAYPITTYYAEEELMVVALDITYAILDILMAAIFFISILLIRGRIGKILMFFLLGCLMVVVYDTCFAYLTLAELYYDGHPIELLDLASYLFDACAFYETYKLYR